MPIHYEDLQCIGPKKTKPLNYLQKNIGKLNGYIYKQFSDC